MPTSLIAPSTWLHTLATVAFIGYYFFTDLIFLPALKASMQVNRLRDLLEQVSIRLPALLRWRSADFPRHGHLPHGH